MGKSIDIVKQGGRRPTESFNRDKLHVSIRAACLSVRSPAGSTEKTAASVCDAVIIWLDTKPEVTSNDIRRVASQHLEKFHPDAAYLYKHHRLII